MSVLITPEPDEAERKAILTALAAEAAAQPAGSEWAEAVISDYDEDEP
jgi:hypothetical protein